MSPEATHAPTVAAFRLAPLSGAGRAVREQDRAAGYAAGFAAGSRAAAEQAAALRATLVAQHEAAEARREAEVAATLSRLRQVVAAADARTAPVVGEVRQAMVAAAVALAEAVLGAELSDEPERARAALARGLAAPAELGVHTVRVSPADHAVLTAASVTMPEGVALVADPRLAPGDAISEHPAGYLDGQLRSAFDRARRALAGEDR